jgi:activator of HSP90 ATPase
MGDKANLAALDKGLTRRQAIVAVAGAFGGSTLGGTPVWAGTQDEISHTADAIHQEPVFTASPKRVYDALTDAKLFTRVVQLSGALQAMHLPDKPAEISRDVGGAFSLFGGFITGRHVELVPNVRVVQAWRPGDWPPGV